jgi:uncharacterized coiled-coil protein SlyX
MPAKNDVLSQLEARVNAAALLINRLRTENKNLLRRMRDLEAKLAADGGAAAWAEEREQIRQRVEDLTGRLEELMEAANESPEAPE